MRKKLKALVVDDAFMNRYALKNALEQMGFKITEATNGEEGWYALEEVGPGKFDLIALDIKMPIMDGAEFMAKAREKYQDQLPPVLVITAEGDLDTVKTLAAHRVAGYILKPIDKDRLCEKVFALFPQAKENYFAVRLRKGGLKD